MNDIRERIAREAARIMSEEAVGNFAAAKRRAAERVGASQRQDLPSNEDIHNALVEYQQLFDAVGQNTRLASMRQVALSAMALLENYRPAAAGSLADGVAPRDAALELHVFADTPDEISMLLHEQGIEHRFGDRRYRLSGQEHRHYPVLSLLVDEQRVEIAVFPSNQRGHAPLSPATGKPMRRLTAKQLRRSDAGGQKSEDLQLQTSDL